MEKLREINPKFEEISCKKEEEEFFLKYREKLREKLKLWERKFKEQKGRCPEKNDIKKDKKIRDYYKLYNQIRTKKFFIDQQNIEKTNINPFLNENTEYKKSPKKDKTHSLSEKDPKELSFLDINYEEIGPTPQKLGKLIGIFDHLNDHSYILEEKYNEKTEDEEILKKNAESSPEKNCHVFQTPSKTPNKNNFLTTPSFLKKTIDISSPTVPRFSFRMSLSYKKGLSSLIKELQQMENDFVNPEEIFKEIKEENSNMPTKSIKENEHAEESDYKDKIIKKKGTRLSKRVILRPSVVIKTRPKESKDQHLLNTLVGEKALEKSNILQENKTLNNMIVQKNDNSNKKSKRKKYIKGKGGVILRSQVSRNYVSYKLKKCNSKIKSLRKK
ncbi:hypothetical protein PORY_001539 [Pneumocystis oryctolagi]|uniref:Uncharacterized protein n=1 Tax=Pneumocystis oryctolagi TaxID=42067 RepID=A0ACB7CHP4_9ASCO|nr:hypothetical protein PORY_001539 [Pneumocystis oryctolagi]